MSTGKQRLLVYIIMFLSIIISVKLVKDIFKLWHADERLVEAEAELKGAKEEQVGLKEALKETEKPEWWEAKVRNTLKMARPNEVVVIVPEEILQASGGGRVMDLTTAEERSNLEKWWQVFVY